MKKIVFFTQSLECGGVQKSVSTLANSLKYRFKVSIILAEDHKDFFYKVDNIDVFKIKTLKINTKEKNVGLKLFDYRKKELDVLLEKISPEIVISYEDYHNLILLNTKYKCKKIISIRNSIYNLYKKEERIHLLDSNFYFENIKLFYPKADKIITVSNHINNELKELCDLSNIVTIYNGISENNSNELFNYHKPFILNVARLNKRKGQCDLIEAFNLIKDNIEHDLFIIGDGVEKEKLQTLIKNLNISDRVKLFGRKRPSPYIKSCDLFVFPSKSEGFSNVVLEVISCKKNILAYNYKGSNEILPAQNTIEIGKIRLLANKILYFLQNEKINEQYADNLFNISKKFTLEKTLENYKKEILSLCVE